MKVCNISEPRHRVNIHPWILSHGILCVWTPTVIRSGQENWMNACGLSRTSWCKTVTTCSQWRAGKKNLQSAPKCSRRTEKQRNPTGIQGLSMSWRQQSGEEGSGGRCRVRPRAWVRNCLWLGLETAYREVPHPQTEAQVLKPTKIWGQDGKTERKPLRSNFR